jgi:hypothetical protein
MFRFYKHISKKNYSGTMHSNIPNGQLYGRQKWSKEVASLQLGRFLKKYFHPYQFFMSTNHPLKSFSSLLFDVESTENNYNQSGHYVKYKVSPNFDPAIKLLSKITNNDNLDVGFKIYTIGNKPLYIFSPGTFLPTHFSLRIRDAIEDQQIKTLTNIEDLKLDRKATIIKNPFEFVLDVNQISTLNVLDSCMLHCRELLEEDKRQRLAEIKNIINFWNNISETEHENMLNMFYHDYYQLYIEGPWHKNTMQFNVHDKNWNLAPLNGVADVNNHLHATNTAAQLIKFSQSRHSSVHGYHVSFTSGGALRINNFCPGIPFFKALGYRIDHDYSGVDVAMRHKHLYDHTKPLDSDDHRIDVLYPFNGFIPYWMVIYLKESCDAFGIKTSELIIPREMQKLSKQENNTNLRPIRG